MANYAQTEVSLGENSKILVVNMPFSVTRGTVIDEPAETILACNESGGYNYRAPGQRSLTVDVEMFWIPSLNPLSNPPNLIPGTNLYSSKILVSPGTDVYTPLFYAVQIWPDAVNGPNASYRIFTAYICPQTVMIDGVGVQSFRACFKNQGYFLSPANP